MILIISPSKKLSRSVSDTFHYMSILSYGTTPSEALCEISGIYRAVLILHPESFPDLKDYISRLKSYRCDIPIFALTEPDYAFEYEYLFEAIYTKPSMTPSLARKMIEYLNEHHLAGIGSYHIGGFDASSNLVGVKYFSTDVNLTKTEAMILRFLAVTYPQPQMAKDIIKYAFKPGRIPEVSSIRTHISMMNNKIEKAIGKKMIGFVSNEGYIVYTPEYLYQNK